MMDNNDKTTNINIIDKLKNFSKWKYSKTIGNETKLVRVLRVSLLLPLFSLLIWIGLIVGLYFYAKLDGNFNLAIFLIGCVIVLLPFCFIIYLSFFPYQNIKRKINDINSEKISAINSFVAEYLSDTIVQDTDYEEYSCPKLEDEKVGLYEYFYTNEHHIKYYSFSKFDELDEE